jgi:hypothetical protein
MTNEPSKETIMKTIHITTDSDIEIRVTKEPAPKEMTLEQLVAVIEDAIACRIDRIDLQRMTEGDREIFPSLIRDMYRHELLNITRIVLTHGTHIRETKRLILRAFDRNFGTFNLPKPLGNAQKCANILSGIACDTIDAYLEPIRSRYTLDRIKELLENVENAFCDALETVNIDAFFKTK